MVRVHVVPHLRADLRSPRTEHEPHLQRTGKLADQIAPARASWRENSSSRCSSAGVIDARRMEAGARNHASRPIAATAFASSRPRAEGQPVQRVEHLLVFGEGARWCVGLRDVPKRTASGAIMVAQKRGHGGGACSFESQGSGVTCKFLLGGAARRAMLSSNPNPIRQLRGNPQFEEQTWLAWCPGGGLEPPRTD